MSTQSWEAAFEHFKVFLITLSIPCMTTWLIHVGLLNRALFFRILFYANMGYVSAKIFVVTMHWFGWLDMWAVMEMLGFRFMTMGIYEGLERVQTSVDIMPPFLLLFVLNSSALGVTLPPLFRLSYLGLSFLSNLLSFSRFLLFVYLCSFSLYILTLSLRRFTRVLWTLIAIALALAALNGAEIATAAIEQRFYSDDNYSSDAVRFEQMEALWREFLLHPWLGKGLGGYVEDYVRDDKLPYSYEVQWVAMLMQFGSFGLLALCLPLGAIAYRLSRPNRYFLAFNSLYALWLLSGFTNPFLISLTSGIVYTMFWVASDSLQGSKKVSSNSISLLT